VGTAFADVLKGFTLLAGYITLGKLKINQLPHQ